MFGRVHAACGLADKEAVKLKRKKKKASVLSEHRMRHFFSRSYFLFPIFCWDVQPSTQPVLASLYSHANGYATSDI